MNSLAAADESNICTKKTDSAPRTASHPSCSSSSDIDTGTSTPAVKHIISVHQPIDDDENLSSLKPPHVCGRRDSTNNPSSVGTVKMDPHDNINKEAGIVAKPELFPAATSADEENKSQKKLEKMVVDENPSNTTDMASSSNHVEETGLDSNSVLDGSDDLINNDSNNLNENKEEEDIEEGNCYNISHNTNSNEEEEGEGRNNQHDMNENQEKRRDQQQHQSIPGAVAVNGITSSRSRESLRHFDSTGMFSVTNEEEKQEDEEEERREEIVPNQLSIPNAFIVDEQDHQTVYIAREIDDSDNGKRIRKLRQCICLVVCASAVIIVAVTVILALRKIKPMEEDSFPPTSPNGTLVDITLVVQLDDKPEETGWSLNCGNQDKLVEGEREGTYEGLTNQRKEESIRDKVYEGGNCTIRIFDTGNDGLGNNGHCEIYYGTDTKNSASLIAYVDGNFANETSSNFVVELPQNYTTWIQVGNDIDGLREYDRAGFSVSMSSLGNIVVVGAPTHDQDQPGSAQVYKFDSSLDQWNLVDRSLKGSVNTTSDGDGFGEAVSISNDGTVIAIGAPHKNGDKGSVYVYNLNTITNTIDLVQELMDNSNINNTFGWSVDVNGDGRSIVVGASGVDEYVKVYHKEDNKNESKWSQLGNTITVTSPGDEFGDSVSVSNNGNVVAIGASQWFAKQKGYVKVYEYNTAANRWDDYGNNNDDIFVGDKTKDQFGHALSLSSNGNIVAIAAPGNDGIRKNKSSCGTIKVFELNVNTNSWEQLGGNIDGENTNDLSGFSQGVKLSDDGSIVAIGSRDSSDNEYQSGSVRIFEYDSNDNKWIQISQDVDGESDRDKSGRSLSLSGDGSMVAIGAYWNDGTNGKKASGHVRIFRRGAVKNKNE